MIDSTIIIDAKTVEDAIEMGLQKLKVQQNDVDIEVLEHGNKGIFGLIGGKDAKVKISIKESDINKSKYFLNSIFKQMGVDVDIEVSDNDQSILLNVTGPDIGIVIGRRGETLESLQYLVNLAINKGKNNYKRIIVDAGNHRKKREETLVRLANRLANRVVKYKKTISLEPMAPYERRIIHYALQDNRYVNTYSVGEEPFRKVIIALKESAT